MLKNNLNMLENISNSNNFILKSAKKCFAFLTNPTTRKKLCTKKKKIYLMLTPQYNNLGDHAITLSSLQWLKSNFSDYNIIEITCNYYKNNKNFIIKKTSEDDILFIVGGGFMGDLWITMENMVRDIISSFPKNKIIVLPQTIYFKSSKEFLLSKQIYSSHSNLSIILRDERSYKLCKDKLLLKNIFFAPDIVTIYDFKPSTINKKNCVGICLRNDLESIDYNISKADIEHCIKQFGMDIAESTTLLKIPFIAPSMRKKLVDNKIKEISSYKIIITNRLHCMLFAYLSKTPCLALDNKSHKVSGVHEWICENKFIKLYNPNEPLKKQLQELLSMENISIDNKKINNIYSQLKKYLKMQIKSEK